VKEATKKFFVKPYLAQISAMVFVVVPIVEITTHVSLVGVKSNYWYYFISSQAVTVLSVMITVGIKYLFARPVIRYVEGDHSDMHLYEKALRSASIMPAAEGLAVFAIWAVITAVVTVIPMYLKSYMSFSEALFLANLDLMCGLTSMVFFYLIAENSLISFYELAGRREQYAKTVLPIRLSLTAKLFLVILLIAFPPIGYLLGFIYLNIHTGIALETVQAGFFLIIIQTGVMTFLNGMLLIRSISRSVRGMSSMLKDVALGRGDLTKRFTVSGNDEVGEMAYWFNDFISTLDALIRQVKEASLKVSGAVREVSGSAQGLSRVSQEQAASIEQVAATIEEMHASVRGNTTLVTEAAETSQVMDSHVSSSSALFVELAGSMDEILKYSEDIGEIVAAVNMVAFQTNLLALNASVEAARAGEHGRGFAVVASEVRALAGRARESSGRIDDLIRNTLGCIRGGDAAVRKTSDSFGKIASCMDSFAKAMQSVLVSSSEQTKGVEELNRTVGQIEQTTQQNAAMAEELAGTSESLKSEAEILAASVQKFRVSGE
jgi:methyl-accepting chemotaxis protein